MNKLLVFIVLLFFFKAEAQNASALRLADSLYALGNYSRAISYYKQLSKSEQQLFKLAKSYEALGNHPKAFYYYQKVISTYPKATLASYNYGKLLFNTSKYRKADSLFKNLSEGHPLHPNFIYYSGLVKEKLNDSSAIFFFRKTYKLDKSHHNALYKIAKHHTEKREFEVAERYISEGLLVDPNSILFLNLKALKYFYSKEYHGALLAYKKLLEFNQSNTQLHENVAISFVHTNQFDKAIEQYTILINRYEDKNSKWHYQIGRAYMALRYYEKAQRHFEIAIALKDISSESEYFALSQLFGKQENYKAQMKALNKAIVENPKNQHTHYFLAVAADNYFKDKKTVIVYYEKYLKMFGEKGRYSEFARQRIKDLKTAFHFNKD